MRHFILLSMGLALGCATSPRASPSPGPIRVLTEAEAVARAEEFIRINGYCKREDADLKRMQVERNLTFGTTPEDLLPQREGSLLPRACGIIAEAVRGFDKGWSVVFCYDPAWRIRNEHPDDRKYSTEDQARVVVMDEYGSDLFVPHTNVTLRFKGIKRLPGMDDYEQAVKGAAEQGVAPDGRSPAAPARR
jgi:hypothetical protein